MTHGDEAPDGDVRLRYWRHMALLFMALFASGPAASMFHEWRDSRFARLRGRAVYGKARAVVLFDRVINNEAPERFCGEDA